MSQRKDLTNQEFGRLTVKHYLRTDNGRAIWHCVCKCGNELDVRTSNLTTGHTQSCGCYQQDQAAKAQFKHGGSVDFKSEYHTWHQMIARCTNPSHSAYSHYGGRGIQVSDRWTGEHGFENFLADMGPRPEGYWLERVDNEGNYEPSNCEWKTIHDQMRNTRRNHLITLDSRTQCLEDWATEIGISPVGLLNRLQSGWSTRRALTEPSHNYL